MAGHVENSAIFAACLIYSSFALKSPQYTGNISLGHILFVDRCFFLKFDWPLKLTCYGAPSYCSPYCQWHIQDRHGASLPPPRPVNKEPRYASIAKHHRRHPVSSPDRVRIPSARFFLLYPEFPGFAESISILLDSMIFFQKMPWNFPPGFFKPRCFPPLMIHLSLRCLGPQTSVHDLKCSAFIPCPIPLLPRRYHPVPRAAHNRLDCPRRSESKLFTRLKWQQC